jgi:hypothetical protein
MAENLLPFSRLATSLSNPYLLDSKGCAAAAAVHHQPSSAMKLRNLAWVLPIDWNDVNPLKMKINHKALARW